MKTEWNWMTVTFHTAPAMSAKHRTLERDVFWKKHKVAQIQCVQYGQVKELKLERQIRENHEDSEENGSPGHAKTLGKSGTDFAIRQQCPLELCIAELALMCAVEHGYRIV